MKITLTGTNGVVQAWAIACAIPVLISATACVADDFDKLQPQEQQTIEQYVKCISSRVPLPVDVTKEAVAEEFLRGNIDTLGITIAYTNLGCWTTEYQHKYPQDNENQNERPKLPPRQQGELMLNNDSHSNSIDWQAIFDSIKAEREAAKRKLQQQGPNSPPLVFLLPSYTVFPVHLTRKGRMN